jgi:C-terminal, D2-small domain, of ClpB protein
LVFTDAAVREIAKIALERGTGARGLRSIVEPVMEGILFDVEAGVRYVITDTTVRGGEALKQSVKQARAPLTLFLDKEAGKYGTGMTRAGRRLQNCTLALYLVVRISG